MSHYQAVSLGCVLTTVLSRVNPTNLSMRLSKVVQASKANTCAHGTLTLFATCCSDCLGQLICRPKMATALSQPSYVMARHYLKKGAHDLLNRIVSMFNLYDAKLSVSLANWMPEYKAWNVHSTFPSLLTIVSRDSLLSWNNADILQKSSSKLPPLPGSPPPFNSLSHLSSLAGFSDEQPGTQSALC